MRVVQIILYIPVFFQIFLNLQIWNFFKKNIVLHGARALNWRSRSMTLYLGTQLVRHPDVEVDAMRDPRLVGPHVSGTTLLWATSGDPCPIPTGHRWVDLPAALQILLTNLCGLSFNWNGCISYINSVFKLERINQTWTFSLHVKGSIWATRGGEYALSQF
jgi:hypothetical protein